jgi:hypothetical protein
MVLTYSTLFVDDPVPQQDMEKTKLMLFGRNVDAAPWRVFHVLDAFRFGTEEGIIGVQLGSEVSVRVEGVQCEGAEHRAGNAWTWLRELGGVGGW